KEITRMGKLSSENVDNSMEAFLNNGASLIESVTEQEKLINFLQREVTDFMVSLSNTNLSEQQSDLITSLFHVVSDMERIGDHAKNIIELTELKINENIQFSDKAIADIKDLYKITKEAVDTMISAFSTFDFKLAKEVIELEGKIDTVEKRFRKDHIDRLNNRICSPAGGAIFVDLLSNFERIGDHSNNVAQMILDQD
ncbi:MAG: PhoU domain-containing protein, partial [Clostridium sp.]|nr:PhoU domain-containing protein [Clostridium sp.]